MASQNLIELIKVLRDRTGAGMMDCKKALESSDLDVEKAIDWLREKGIAKAAAKAARIAAEGVASVICKGNKAIIGEVNCETDFVSKGEQFHKLTNDALEMTLDNDVTDIEKARELTNSLFADATVAMGEKFSYRRYELVEKTNEEGFGSYIHMGGKIAVLVLLNKVDEESALGLAMHIAANNPLYITDKDIPLATLEKERSIALEAAKTDEKLANKPEKILHSIVEGKVKKFLSEQTLVDQTYLLDSEKTVGQYLKEKGLVVEKFYRYVVGEGIEKRVDNFAEEVMSQVNSK